MTRPIPENPPSAPKPPAPALEDHELTPDEQLDEALEESFPASDAPSMTRHPQE